MRRHPLRDRRGALAHALSLRELPQADWRELWHLRPGRRAKFRLLAGDELMTRYESAPGSFRAFCRVCGSLAPGQAPYLPTVSVPAGLLDDDPVVRPRLHV